MRRPVPRACSCGANLSERLVSSTCASRRSARASTRRRRSTSDENGMRAAVIMASVAITTPRSENETIHQRRRIVTPPRKSTSRARPPRRSPAFGVAALAAELDALPLLLAVLAAVLAVGAATLDTAFARRMRTLLSHGHLLAPLYAPSFLVTTIFAVFPWPSSSDAGMGSVRCQLPSDANADFVRRIRYGVIRSETTRVVLKQTAFLEQPSVFRPTCGGLARRPCSRPEPPLPVHRNRN